MNTYNQILKPEYHSKILAHTSASRDKEPETLIVHSQKTLEYFDFLIKQLSLKDNIDNILSQLVNDDKQKSDILELIRSIVYYHDLGKINPVFQKEKMKNDLRVDTQKLNSNHSFYGKVLFDNLFYDAKDYSKKTSAIFFLLSQTIDRHHTALNDIDSFFKKMQKEMIQKELDDLDAVSERFFIKCRKLPLAKDLAITNKFKAEDDDDYDIRRIFNEPEQQEALFYLYKIVYSLLITSDYYATSDFIQNVSYFDKISTINPNIIKKCIDNFYNYKFNKKLTDHTYCENMRNAEISEIDDLDDLRTRILLESDSKLEKIISESPEQKIFYLNVPTGGGKTNISLKLALTLLKSKKDIKRVFYVFPFINLIEQNHDVIKKTIGLDKELSPIYSSSTWSVRSDNKDERLQYVIDNEFLNHQFVVISNVNFFNTFIKSGKSSNYRLVNLANSVVIIDEIQSLNDKDWTLFNDLITFGSRYLNIHFIIMSATLPKLYELSDKDMSKYVCNVSDDAYLNHPLFKNRLSIEYRDDVNDTSQLLDVAKNEFHDDMNKVLLVVNTIGSSLELYRKVKADKKIKEMGFSVCLLNSTILPHRRREIIKKMEKGQGKVILVSTQSVEAGIDIDCDFGIRDFAIFDSIEQIAGRINRNSKNQKSSTKLIVVNLKKDRIRMASFIYKDTHRWETICGDDFMLPEQIQGFFKERDFGLYYKKVLENIEGQNRDMLRCSSQDLVTEGIRHLNFEKLDREADVIKQDSVSLIVDVTLQKKDENFSESEWDFIKSIGFSQNEVSGRDMWKRYNEFCTSFQTGFIDKKINTKIWSSILSKFMINTRKEKIPNEIRYIKEMLLLKSEYYSDEEGIDLNNISKDSFSIHPASSDTS